MAVTNPADSYNAGLDANGFPSLTALSGTAGTADTTGTAEIFAIGGNPTTGALYVQDLSGAAGTTTVQMVSGTLNVGTVVISSSSGGTNVNVITGTLLNTGTNINVVTGTLLNTGTNVNVITGTQQLLTTVSNLTNGSINLLTGTVNVGTVTAYGNAAPAVVRSGNPVPIAGTDSGGTIYIPLVTTGGILAANVPTGTVTTGTLALVSTVSNLTNGSINVLTGTVTRVSNLGTLEVGSVSITNTPSVNVATGTQQTLGTVGVLNNGTLALVSTVTTVSNLTNGSINVLTGTMTRVSNVGTLESGTVRIDSVPPVIGTSYGTLGTAGAATWGTLIAASGAGTRQYVSGLSVVVASGTVDCAITNVGTVATIGGAGILTRGQFPAGGGIMRDFFPAMVSGTNGTLSFWVGGAGTAYFTVQYLHGV